MNFKKLPLIIALSGLFASPAIFAQEAAKPVEEYKPSGKVDGRIYADHYTTTSQPETGALSLLPKNGFELKRAYFGYGYQFAPVWSARVMLDITNDKVLTDRSMYFKHAFLQYSKGPLKATFGIQDTYNFMLNDKIYGKRYLHLPFYDQFKYYTSADLGASVEYTLGNYTIDLSIYNGEGFRQVQSDNAYRTGLGITGKFIDKKLTARVMADYLNKEYQQSSLSAFLSYQVANKFTLGGEIDFQYHPDYNVYKDNVNTTPTNFLMARDKNHYGVSLFGMYYFAKNWNVFTRYDYVTSTSLTDENSYAKRSILLAGNQVISGVEYVYSKNLRFAADYQTFNPELGGVKEISKVFLHAEVAF